jgi:rhodanese-related sulfurtransferase
MRRSSTVNVDTLAREVEHETDHITAAQLNAWIREHRSGLRIIDLRSDSEYAVNHIPGAEHMPVSQLREAGFLPNETIVLVSAGGGHAAQGWFLLRTSGLEHIYSLRGGMDEWNDKRSWRGRC